MHSHPVLPLLRSLADDARRTVARSLRESSPEARSRTDGHAGSDVIYAIDREVEANLLETLAAQSEALGGIVLVAEGIGADELTVHPSGENEAACRWRLLVDPIDGTRGIMVDKRSAWFLAGVAQNKGPATRLRDIECAVLAELPTSRAAVADSFTAVRGKGVEAVRHFLVEDRKPETFSPQAYAGASIRGGFAQVARFFPPGREELAALEEALMATLFPDAAPGEILNFEDQYISTGGQLAELMQGRDRFTADLRASLYASPPYAGRRPGHVCHPYDLAAMLVAEEAGVVLTNPDGNPLDGPFDTRSASDWIGYANPEIRAEVEPVLLDLLRQREWI